MGNYGCPSNFFFFFKRSTLKTLSKISLYQPTVYLMLVSKQYWRWMHMQSNLLAARTEICCATQCKVRGGLEMSDVEYLN